MERAPLLTFKRRWVNFVGGPSHDLLGSRTLRPEAELFYQASNLSATHFGSHDQLLLIIPVSQDTGTA